MPLTVITKVQLAHIITDHVRLDQKESFEKNKGVFNPNWLFLINENFEKALGMIAKQVVDEGEPGRTIGAVEVNSWDYYLNFNKKTGFQGKNEDGDIVWYKGVVVRGILGVSILDVKTMFPKGVLKPE